MKLIQRLFLYAVFCIAAISPFVAQAACTQFTSTNSAHVTAGRATPCGFFNIYACAVGSGQNMGYNGAFITTTLKETSPGYFELGTCPIPVGSPPEVGSWELQLNAPNFTPSNINVTDADGDLSTIKVEVTNSRNSLTSMLNCPFSPVGGSTTDFRSSDCDTYTAPQWGMYTFTPIATDLLGNSTRGDSLSEPYKAGSTAPVLSLNTYYLTGSVLTVNGVVTDVDNDVERVVLGVIPIFGTECAGLPAFTCTVDVATLAAPGTPINFILYAEDSVTNQSNMETFTVTVPPAASCFTGTNSAHAAAGRATQFFGLYFAVGSGTYLGSGTTTTSLKQTSPGTWTKVASCS